MKEKRRKVIMVTIPIVLGVLLIVGFSEAGEKLQIRIWTDKSEFFLHEPISVHYEVKNISDSTVHVSFGMIQEDFVIRDAQGRGYSTHLRGTFMGGDPLRPGESHHATLNICGQYKVVNVSEYTCYLYTCPSAVLHFPWTKSNTIKFKVIEPKGEEKKALDLYLEAEKLSWARSEAGGPDLTKKELGFLKYIELVDKYPKSVYAPLALSSAWGTYRYSQNLEDRKKNIPVYKRLIENYPNSLYVASAFCGLVETYEKFKDKSGAIQAMKELIKKYPNTNISERAEYWLEKIEKWEFK
jgi:hypothetical protein